MHMTSMPFPVERIAYLHLVGNAFVKGVFLYVHIRHGSAYPLDWPIR